MTIKNRMTDMKNETISEVLARNGLTDRDFRVTRDLVPSLAPPPPGWVNMPGPRRVLETVARLLEVVDHAVPWNINSKADTALRDARAVLAEVLR